MTDRQEIAAREAEILGQPPRVPPLPREEIDPAARAALAEVLRAIGRDPPEHPSDHVAIMLRNPAIYRAHSALGLALYTGALPVRWRELAVLRVAWHCRAPYEWGEHVDLAKRLGGLTGEEVERVTQGASAPGWSAGDRAILRAVEELLEGAMICDATWGELAGFLDQRQLIELPVLVGQYQGVAYLQNALRCPLLPGNPGLAAR